MPPPPPPPLPGMGRGAGGPPPPPPGGLPSRPPVKAAGRGALLSSIEQGARLKKVTVINDRSAPIVGKVSDGPPAPAMGAAPKVPGMPSRPSPGGLAPPPPTSSRARSNSDGGDGGSAGGSGGAPQLAGLFAGGMPKLRKTAGKVDTGASNQSPYLSDPESSRAAPRPPTGTAPKPPSAPRVPGSAPPPLPSGAPSIPSVSQLRGNLRPSSLASFSSTSSISSKPRPAPPIGKKPPVPPPSSRKPSSNISQTFPSTPASAPPPPPGAAPRPPVRSTPPPPVPNGSSPGPSLAEQAARNAFSRSSPAAPLPPRPQTSPPVKQSHDDDYDPYNYSNGPPRASPALGTPPPPPPPNAAPAAPSAPPPPPALAPRPSTTAPTQNVRSMLDISTSHLASLPQRPGSTHTIGSNGNRSSSMTMSTTRTNSSYISREAPKPLVRIQDSRWRFQDESQFPKPREFSGVQKKYRAGRVSSVPLDLSAYE